MRHREIKSPVDWAMRVNRSWLVRSNLNDHTEDWLSYLSNLEDGRLLRSCQIARDLCNLRQNQDDPKPWFYSGIFQLATADESKRFLDTHHVTKSMVPTMESDPEVLLWLDRIGPETRKLLDRLREDLAQVRRSLSVKAAISVKTQ